MTAQRSDFLRNILTLASGTAVAQVIGLAVAPITSRIYAPADYGVLGVYMSISVLVTTAATLLYHQPVVLTRDDDDARSLVAICLASTLGATAIAALVVLLIGHRLAQELDAPNTGSWFLLVPVSVFASGVATALQAWANRRGAYAALSRIRVASTVVPIPITIGLGLAVRGPAGLVLGLVTSHVISALGSALAARSTDLRLRGALDGGRMLALAREHRKYPLYTLPSDLLLNFTVWLPVHLLLSLAGASAVGAYSMANRLLGLPLALIGSSVGEVFRQQASKDCADSGQCRDLFVSTAKHATLLSVPLFAVLAFVGPHLFAFVLGEQWRQAGAFAQVLSLVFALRFIVSPLSVMYFIRDRQREDLLLHFAMIVGVAVSMYVGSRLSSASIAPLVGYAVAYSGVYIVYLIRSYQFASVQ